MLGCSIISDPSPDVDGEVRKKKKTISLSKRMSENAKGRESKKTRVYFENMVFY